MNEERNPLKEVVCTVAFTMPEMTGTEDRAGVLLHVKTDTEDSDMQAYVLKWLLDVVASAGGEPHWELCGMGDTVD